MPNPNTLDLSNDPDGLKAAIQQQFESARLAGDAHSGILDIPAVTPAQADQVDTDAGDPTTWPLPVADAPVAPSVSDVFVDWPLEEPGEEGYHNP